MKLRCLSKNSKSNQNLTFIQECRNNVTLFDCHLIYVCNEIFAFVKLRASWMTATIRAFIGFVVQIFVYIQQKLRRRFPFGKNGNNENKYVIQIYWISRAPPCKGQHFD